jgi:glutathione S-transferase
MQLYDHPLSPYAMRVRIILREKGIPFEAHELGAGRAFLPPAAR